MPLKLSVSFRLAALEPLSKSYANRMARSAFVQLSRNRGNEKKREAREDRVNFRSACRPAGMTRHNQNYQKYQQRSVGEVRSLLGGTHAMRSVKPNIDIIEGLSTGVNMDASAPHLTQKWLNESRQSPSFMLGGLGSRKVTVTFFLRPAP